MATELSAYALLELDEAKTIISAGENFNANDLLILYVNGITELIENICGENFKEREYVEIFDGDGTNKHRVLHSPVLTGGTYTYEVISEEDGAAIATANILINKVQGIFYLESNVFVEGFQNCQITYTAGRATIPEGIRAAAAIVLARFWKLRDKAFENVASVSNEGQTVTFNISAVPSEALGMLARYRKPRFA